MTPYYQDDYITLFHGDCLDLLPGLVGIDSIVTDPPYGIDYEPSGGNGLAIRGNLPQVIGDDKPFDPLHLLVYLNIISWGANHYADKLPVMPSWLCWDKREGIKSDNHSDLELAWTNLGGPARIFNHYWKGMIKASEKDTRRQHPTQKPVALMRWCIQQIKQPGLICDPYTGSGSTLVAAKQLGLKAIGIEIVESYCEVAARRVGQTSVMFPEVRVIVSAEQAVLFAEAA